MQAVFKALSTTAAKSFIAPMPELKKLMDAIKKGSASVDDLSTYFTLVGKDADDAADAAEELADALDKPLLDAIKSVSDAFGDFISNGLRDFKSFANSIVDSFKRMISTMISTAMNNRIMISLGMGGSGFASGVGAAGTSSAFSGPMGTMMGTLGSGTAMTAGSGMSGLMGSMAGGTGFMGGVGNFAAGGYSALTTGSGLAAGAAGAGTAAAALGAVIVPILAVAAAISFLSSKTKVLDSGLKATVTNMDATIESFKKLEKSRFFGLSKRRSTTSETLSDEEAAPMIKAIQEIQTSVMDAAATLDIAGDVFDDFSHDFTLSLIGLSEEAKAAAIAEEFTKMGDAFASMTGHFKTMNELLAVANQRYGLNTRLLQLQGNGEELLRRQRKLEMEATHDLNKALLQTIYTIEDAIMAANMAANKASQNLADANQGVADATANLRQAIDAEKGRIQASFASLISGLTERLDVANEAMGKSRSIYEMLSNALSSRQVDGDSAFAGRRSSSLEFLRGGDFKDEDKLENALSVVSEPSEQLFGSFVDYARDFGRTSAIIDDAKSIARVQLEADEKQVLLLQQQIDNAKASEQAQLDALDKQFEALTNVNSSVLSVRDAIGALGAAMQAQAAAMQAQAAAAAAAGAAAAAAANANAGSGSDLAGTANFGGVPSTRAGRGAVLKEQFGTGTKHSSGFDLASIGSSAELMQAAASVGVKTAGQTGAQIQKDIANASGLAVGMSKSIRALGFATGGMHQGGMRMVGERGPELEATGPSRIFSSKQTSKMFSNPELVEEIRGLRSEVSGLRSEQRQMQASSTKYVKRNYDINRKWDVDGLPATRT